MMLFISGSHDARPVAASSGGHRNAPRLLLRLPQESALEVDPSPEDMNILTQIMLDSTRPPSSKSSQQKSVHTLILVGCQQRR
uniref:Uncharacterized protein n=1 Tax=Steinernema glaseri TaxID=37863 RepID=A0A1I8AM96_9BILA